MILHEITRLQVDGFEPDPNQSASSNEDEEDDENDEEDKNDKDSIGEDNNSFTINGESLLH